MYKILVADDEGIVLNSLKLILEKKYGEICQLKMVKTGRQVIEAAREFLPDIVLIDIQMPGINGIEAMREVKSFHSQTLFIVISAYDKFTFAQKTMNLGAIEYITKPFTKDRIIKAVDRAMELTDRERSRRKTQLQVMERLQAAQPVIENGFISLILFQENYSSDMEEYKMLLEIKADYGCMAVLESGEWIYENKRENSRYMDVPVEKRGNMIREIIKEFFPSGVIGPAIGNRFVFFLPFEEEQQEYEARMKLIGQGRKMVHKLRIRLGLKFRAGFGQVKEFDQLRSSYEEARKALRFSEENVVHINDLISDIHLEKKYPIQYEEKILNYVKEGDTENAGKTAAGFFECVSGRYQDCFRDMQTKCLELVMNAERVMYCHSGISYSFLSRTNYIEEVLGCKSYTELQSWFVRKIRQASQSIIVKKEENNNSVVGKAKIYMEQRFTEDLSLEEVARQVDVSSYYFSKLFKEESGENFIDYLTSLRITKAKELIEQDHMTIKQVCYEVGYSDPNYFSRLFKKNVGCTPTEYKERRRKK